MEFINVFVHFYAVLDNAQKGWFQFARFCAKSLRLIKPKIYSVL